MFFSILYSHIPSRYQGQWTLVPLQMELNISFAIFCVYVRPFPFPGLKYSDMRCMIRLLYEKKKELLPKLQFFLQLHDQKVYPGTRQAGTSRHVTSSAGLLYRAKDRAPLGPFPSTHKAYLSPNTLQDRLQVYSLFSSQQFLSRSI